MRQQHKRHAREVTPAQLIHLQRGAQGEAAPSAAPSAPPSAPLAHAPGGGAALASQLSQAEQVGVCVENKAQ